MTHDDAIWSYAEEFAEKILQSASAESIDSALEEIAERMSYELNKRDRRKVLERLETLMMISVAEGRVDKTKWERAQNKLASFVGL